MYVNWIRHCYRGIWYPRISQNSSTQGQPEFQNAIRKHNIHFSRWNKFKDDTKQRKTRGESKGIELKEDTTLKQDEAHKFEEKIRELPEKTITYFEKLRRGNFLKLPSSSTALPITIPNKAREYNENVRQRISAKIFKIVGRFSLSSSKNADEAAEVVIKPAKPIQSGEKDIYMKECVVKTNINRASETEKVPSDAKVSEYVNRHMAPSPSPPSPPIVKCGCMGFKSSVKLPNNAATGTEKKEDKGGLNSFKRRLSKHEEDEGDLMAGNKKSREVDIKEQKSLLHKYTIKSPGALDANEFSDQNKSISQRLSSQNRQDNHKPPIYVKYRKQSHKHIEVMPLRQKSTKKSIGNKKELKKTDEMLAKLGLIDDKNLRNKIDGDLFMNIWDILEKAEKRKISGVKGEMELDETERDLVKAKKNRGDGDNAKRSDRQRRKAASSKKRKHDKSDIEQILDGDVVHHFPVNKKLNLVPRKAPLKSKRRRIKVKKGKGGMKRKRSRKIGIKEKKMKPKRCGVDDCGNLSQNE